MLPSTRTRIAARDDDDSGTRWARNKDCYLVHVFVPCGTETLLPSTWPIHNGANRSQLQGQNRIGLKHLPIAHCKALAVGFDQLGDHDMEFPLFYYMK